MKTKSLSRLVITMNACFLFGLALKVPAVLPTEPDGRFPLSSIKDTNLSYVIRANEDNNDISNEFIYMRSGGDSWWSDAQLVVGYDNVFTRRNLVFMKKAERFGQSEYGTYIGNTVNNGHSSASEGLSFFTGGSEAMTIHKDQHVSIGTYKKANHCVLTVDGAVSIGPSGTNPENFRNTYASDYLLWVEKGIVADDLVLAKPDDWDDEVFEEDYELRSLEEIEAYVKENKHLPEVPCESDILKNGYRVHDMNRIFIRKIEELTLYTIEQEKQIEALKEQLSK